MNNCYLNYKSFIKEKKEQKELTSLIHVKKNQ